MGARQIKVGHDLYMFTMKNAGNSTAAILDAHGQRDLFGRHFTVPAGLTIKFYVAKHAWLEINETRKQTNSGKDYIYSDGLYQIATGVPSVEDFGPGAACPDYLLSKDDQMHKAQDVKLFLKHRVSDEDVDVLTVRNRGMFQQGIRLSTAVRHLNGRFTELRCCFCRGTVRDDFFPKFGGQGFSQRPGGF